MNAKDPQPYIDQFEDILYQLGVLMLDIMQITLDTIHHYQQLFDKDLK